jgi:hypothetical protein
MAGLEKLRNVFHVIRAWLYPNYLEHGGKYIARIKTDKTLTVEEVCAAAVTRGGAGLNFNTMVEAVNAYFEEALYQLADGFGVENDFYVTLLKLGGTYDHADSKVDKEHNHVDFIFLKRKPMRDIINHIDVQIEGVAENGSYIAEVQDVASGTTNERLTSGGVMTVLGNRIKIAGEETSCGLYLVNTADETAVKIPGNFVENHPSRLSVQLPALTAGSYRVRVVTQYTHGSTLLKEPRQIDYSVELAVT